MMQGITEKPGVAGVGGDTPRTSKVRSGAQLRTFGFLVATLALFFAKPLYDLLHLSLKEEIYSHIILIPFISAYLIGQRRSELPVIRAGAPGLGVAIALIPVALLGLAQFGHFASPEILALRILSFCLFIPALACGVLGPAFVRSIAFPLFFMLFAVPLPPSIINPLETASKIASTEVYAWMMDITQSTYLRNGFIFDLPGLSIEVAQECSGIRSSLVLFIVSTLAANLFLSTTWRRVVFCIFVIPLGFLRNGFRIFTLSFLSVHWDKSVIDSPLHHRGGPIFFTLSLIPFCLVLAWLRKSEERKRLRSKSPGIEVSA